MPRPLGVRPSPRSVEPTVRWRGHEPRRRVDSANVTRARNRVASSRLPGSVPRTTTDGKWRLPLC